MSGCRLVATGAERTARIAGHIGCATATADAISGTFTVTFDLNGPLTGTFTAVECATGYYPTFP